MLWIVTRNTRDGAVARQTAVVEQPPSEFDFLQRHRIVLRDRQVQIQSQRDRDQDQQCAKENHLLGFAERRKFSSTQISLTDRSFCGACAYAKLVRLGWIATRPFAI